MKKKINGLVVVEGKSDTQRLQKYYDVETFETSGMGINESMLVLLEKAAMIKPIIIFTDPDMPGEYIRNKISERIPDSLHVIINKSDAKSKNNKKIGVEHAEFQAIDEAFAKIHLLEQESTIDFHDYLHEDMLNYGFIGQLDSKKKRDYFSEELHLGKVNAKQFLKRLNLFMIKRADLESTLVSYDKENEE